MKVKELMKRLQDFPEFADVRVEVGNNFGSVTDLELDDESQYGDELEFVYIIAKDDCS